MAYSAPSSKAVVPRLPEVSNRQVSPEQYASEALLAMQSLRDNACPHSSRAGLINKLLRDISAQRFKPEQSKQIVHGLVQSVRNGYVPNESVNVIANAALGEMSTWSEADRATMLRDFLIAIADVGHSDLLRLAIMVSAIRMLDETPPPESWVRADLTLWLGYTLVRNYVPSQLHDEVVRVSLVALRSEDLDVVVRGKIAWVLSTLVDVAEFPKIPVDDIVYYSGVEAVAENLREQMKNNLNRRALMSVGYF